MADFWDKVSGIYDLSELVNGSVNRGIESAVRELIPKGAKVLDCAAGTGLLTFAAAENAGHVTCTDYSPKMLTECMKKARKKGVKNISFARRDINSLRDGDNTYDIVMAGNVIHLLDDPSKAFAELIRVAKPGGKIIIPTYLHKGGFMASAAVGLYKAVGFKPKKGFDVDAYLNFISENAEACGCKEYSTRLIMGRLPAGFAVITK